jgi:hypothetical protein
MLLMKWSNIFTIFQVTQLKIRYNPFAKAFQDARDRPHEINNNQLGNSAPNKVIIGDSVHSASPPTPTNWCSPANISVGNNYNQQNMSGNSGNNCIGNSGGSSLHCERLATLRSHRAVPYSIDRPQVSIKRSPSPYGMLFVIK